MSFYKQCIHYLVITVIIHVLFSCSSGVVPSPKVHDGTIDLRSWNFKHDGTVALKGDWKFIWMQDNESFSSEKADTAAWESLKIPSSWNRTTGSGSGYGWVRLKILLPDDRERCASEDLGLYLSEVFTAYELYINNKKVVSNGTFGKDAATAHPELFPRRINLKLGADTREVSLALRIANFHHARGGVREAPILGYYDDICRRMWHSDMWDLIIFGILLMMIIYHLLIHFNMQHDNASLYFALCCILVFFRVFSANNYIERLFPGFDLFELRYKIEYLTIAVGYISFTGFFQNLYPLDFKRVVTFIIYTAGVLLTLTVIFTRCIFYSTNVLIFDIVLVFASLYCIVFIFIAAKRKRDNALLILIGFFLFFITIINDIFHSQSIIYTANLTHFGLTLMIVSQSVAIIRRFAQAMKTVARNEQLEEELEIAHMITSRLLPTEKIQLRGICIDAHYKPVDTIGGDFYDYTIKNGKLELFIADVSGHGLPSAFISLITKMALDQIDNKSVTNDVLSLINKTIMRSTVKSIFVTCFFCIIDPEKKSIVFSNAGHFPPLLYRKETDEFLELDTRGIALGWFEEVKIEECSISLQEDDRIVFYTDGILECRNEKGEMFGYDRFKESIRQNRDKDAKEFSRSLISRVEEFLHSSCMDDDSTLIVVDIEPC